MGTLIKDWWRSNYLPQMSAKGVYHVTVMPCYDKKLEASRTDFALEEEETREVDCVLTTGEVLKMMQEKSLDLVSLAETYISNQNDLVFPPLLAAPGTSSGSYLHQTITQIIQSLPASTLSTVQLQTKQIRGQDYIDYTLATPSSTLFKGATCYGFRNLQNLVRKLGREKNLPVSKGALKAVAIKRPLRKKKDAEEDGRGYDYIEVMACPSGCVNGGGQLSSASKVPEIDEEGLPMVDEGWSGKDWVENVETVYWKIGAMEDQENLKNGTMEVHESLLPYLSQKSSSRTAEDLARKIKEEMVGTREWCRTQYRAVESEEINGLAVKW